MNVSAWMQQRNHDIGQLLAQAHAAQQRDSTAAEAELLFPYLHLPLDRLWGGFPADAAHRIVVQVEPGQMVTSSITVQDRPAS